MPTESHEKSRLLSIGMLWYLAILFSTWYYLHISPFLLIAVVIFGVIILVGLLASWNRKVAFVFGFLMIFGVVWYMLRNNFYNLTDDTNTTPFTGLVDDNNPEYIAQISWSDLTWSDLISGDNHLSWSIVTWKSINTGVLWVETWVVTSGTIAQKMNEKEVPIEKSSEKNLFSVSRDNTIVTYALFLPLLQKKYTLPSKGSINFTFVTSKNPLYPSFLAAFQKGMIGVATNPLTQLKCKYVMTMIGLAEAPALQKWGINIHEIYWQYAKDRGYLNNGCDQKDALATLATLP